jgi:hypothetical protein
MPVCSNGPTCKFIVSRKGCKFEHTLPDWLVGRKPDEQKVAIANWMYPEIKSALIQAQMSPEIADQMHSILVNRLTLNQLIGCVIQPDFMAEKMVETLD